MPRTAALLLSLLLTACSSGLDGAYTIDSIDLDTCGLDNDDDDVYLTFSCGAKALLDDGVDCSDDADRGRVFMDLHVDAFWTGNGRRARCSVPDEDLAFDCTLTDMDGDTTQGWSGSVEETGIRLWYGRQRGDVFGDGGFRDLDPYCETHLFVTPNGSDTRGLEGLALLSAAVLVSVVD